MVAVTIETRDGDDADFIQLAGRLVHGECALNSLEDAYLIRIDNWFSQRWLGFQGKAMGAVSVHQRKLPGVQFIGLPNVPPFHPNRVLSQEVFSLRDGSLQALQPKSKEIPRRLWRMHFRRSGPSNLRFGLSAISHSAVFAWYSGNSSSSPRASLMVWVRVHGGTRGWYIELEKDAGSGAWEVKKKSGLAAREWDTLLAKGA